MPSQTIRSIDGVTICLQVIDDESQKSYNYETAPKVDPTTGKCPELLVPCSDITSVINTICVEPAEKPSLCPITDIKIVAKNRIDEFEPSEGSNY